MVPIQSQRATNQILLTSSSDVFVSQLVPTSDYVFKIEEHELSGLHAANFRVSLTRLLFLHNIGDVPVQFQRPKFDTHDCRSLLGIWVETCQPFSLIDTHKIELHIDEYLKDLVRMDSINLNFYSQNYYIAFKLKFQLPPQYQSDASHHHHDDDEASQSILNLALLLVSLVFMAYNLYNNSKSQKCAVVHHHQQPQPTCDSTFMSCHLIAHQQQTDTQKSVDVTAHQNSNDSTVPPKKRNPKDNNPPPTQSSDQNVSIPLVEEVAATQTLESLDTIIMEKTESSEAPHPAKLTKKQQNRQVRRLMRQQNKDNETSNLMDELRPLPSRNFDLYEPYIELHLNTQLVTETEQISFSESEIKCFREDASLRQFDQDSVIKENLGEILTGEQEKIKFLEMYAKCDEDLKREEQSS